MDACQDTASLGDFRELIMRAHDVAHQVISYLQAQGTTEEQRAVAVVDALEAYFVSGGKEVPLPASGEPEVQGPWRAMVVDLAERLRSAEEDPED